MAIEDSANHMTFEDVSILVCRGSFDYEEMMAMLERKNWFAGNLINKKADQFLAMTHNFSHNLVNFDPTILVTPLGFVKIAQMAHEWIVNEEDLKPAPTLITYEHDLNHYINAGYTEAMIVGAGKGYWEYP